MTEREELNLEEELSAAGQVIESLPRKEGQKGGIAILISWLRLKGDLVRAIRAVTVM